jgi:hypothetical protein
MPGRPFTTVIKKKISDLGGADWIEDQISNGRMLTELSKELGCSRTVLVNIIKANPEYSAALDGSRHAQSEAMAEASVDIIDELTIKPDLTSQDVQLAKERVAVRKWFAQVNNPDKFAPKPQTQSVTLNIGTLHLDALRKSRVIDVTPEPKLISDE